MCYQVNVLSPNFIHFLFSSSGVHWGRWGSGRPGAVGRCLPLPDRGHPGKWWLPPRRILHPPTAFSDYWFPGSYATEGASILFQFKLTLYLYTFFIFHFYYASRWYHSVTWSFRNVQETCFIIINVDNRFWCIIFFVKTVILFLFLF